MGGSRPLRTTRLYGALVAFASGGYSMFVGASGGTLQAWLMLGLGFVIVLHGAVLLTDWADWLGDTSGPLMVVYALLMLASQAWNAEMPGVGPMDGGGMGPGPGGAMGGGMLGLGWDLGMVTLALLMLASGVVMTVRTDGM